MNPLAILFLLATLWSLCNFWLVPLSTNRWKAVDLREKMARAGSLVVLERARDLSAIGAAVLGAVILLVWLCEFFSTSSSVLPQAVVHAAQSMYAVTRDLSSQYGSGLGLLGLIGACISLYFAARQARARVAHAWNTRAQALYDSVLEDPASLEAARSDPDLNPTIERLDALVESLAAHEAGIEGRLLSPEEVEQTQNSVSHLLSVLAIEWARKDLKFEDAIATPTEQELLTPTTRWQRLMRMLSSERLGKDLGLVKKPLSYVTTALLVLSLIGWSAEPLANSMKLMVNNLQMTLSDQQAQREVDQAITALPPASSAPDAEAAQNSSTLPTVQAATRLFARAAISEMTKSSALEHWVQISDVNRSDSEFIRAALNDQHIDVPGPRDAGADAATAAKVRKEVSSTLGEAVDDKAGITAALHRLEDALEPSVRQLKEAKPDLFAKLAASLERRYGTPISPLDAQGKLIAQVLDEAFGTLDIKPSTELGKQAQRLVKDVGKEAVKTWTQAWAKNWMTEALVGGARPNVHTVAARQASLDATDDSRRLVRSILAADGQNWTSSAAAMRETQIASAISADVIKLHDHKQQQGLRDRLGGYDELFPGSGAGAPHSEYAFRRARATNFKLASVSSRVRGVLIGQESQSAGVDITRIRWGIAAAPDSTISTKLALEVMADDHWHNLGTYDAAIVNQALRYASDERVIAVTIAPGDGKTLARVTYTHPVLTDTPLGCRVVEADRLIDTFSFSEPQSPAMAKLSSDRRQAMRWMMVVRLTEALAALAPTTACPTSELAQVLTQNEFELAPFSAELNKSLEDFITQREPESPGSGVILRAALACMKATGNDQLTTCLCDKANGIGLPDRYWFPEDHTSQFRERYVAAGPDWNWMKRSPDRLGNIDLWIHTTFSLRNAEDAEGDVNESTSTGLSFPSGELNQLRGEVSKRLPDYVKTELRSPTYEAFMTPLEDFVLLQRFFRTALAGGLGQDFPLMDLISLEQATSEYVPYQPTIRWEGMPNVDLANFLQKADPEARQKYLQWHEDRIARETTGRPVCAGVSK